MANQQWLLVAVMTLGTIACSSVGGYQAQESTTAPPEAEAAVQAARDDLWTRMGSPDEAQVRLVEQVDWPDSSLGCPQPDMMYAQVITPGYRVVLALDDQEYVYHTSASRAVFCPQDTGGNGASVT